MDVPFLEGVRNTYYEHKPCTIGMEHCAYEYNHVQGFLFRLNSSLIT